MTVFILIFVFTGLLFLVAKIGINPFQDFKNNARIGTGITFMFTGVSHFLMPDTFMKLMPPFIPYPLLMIYLSGGFEILGGIGLIISKTKVPASYGLILLLLAVFPANIYVALENIQLGGFMNYAAYQWFRVVLQFVLISWVFWIVREERNEESDRSKKSG
jgi:uncharacterized membrane protein